MSREIRFRAWDKKSQKFRGINGTRDLFSIRCDGFISEDYLLMQFTGLTDKNGVEIYEGDVLDLGMTVNGCNLFIVVWDESRIGWSVKYNVKMNTPRNYEYDINDFFRIDENTDEGIEVIGNIYENPELLEKQP